MTELEKKIYNEIAKRNGIKVSDIAKILGVEKKDINSTLSKSAALKALVKQESDYKWYLLSENKRGAGVSAPKPDEELHRICLYYLQCISMEASNSVSQFLESKYNKEYAVLEGLEIDAGKDSEAIELLNRISGNRDKKAYLGYPVRIYTVYGKDMRVERRKDNRNRDVSRSRTYASGNTSKDSGIEFYGVPKGEKQYDAV